MASSAFAHFERKFLPCHTVATRLKGWRSARVAGTLSSRFRLPGRRFGRDAVMFLTYGRVIVSYSRGKLTRASDVARQLECPPETARRHLRQLTELGLLEREKNTYRPSQNVGPILGLNETTRAVRQAAVALGLCKR